LILHLPQLDHRHNNPSIEPHPPEGQTNQALGQLGKESLPDFTLTPAFDLVLLHTIGMDAEFELILKNVGWELLTIEFLCTLQPNDTEVSFRLFGKEFSLAWQNFSGHLGFPAQFNVDVDTSINDFGRHKF
jgi:hypothetical protein